MRHSLALLPALLTGGLVACGNATPEPAAPAPKADAAPAAKTAQSCTFTAKPEGTSVGWTAFKFTEKTGVGGGFDAFQIKNAKAADSAWKALDGLSFAIETASVNSKNPDRDAKIKEHFFGTMAETTLITGSLKATSATEGQLELTMNGATHAVPVKLGPGEGDAVNLKGTINVDTWGGAPAISALNKVCEDLHKGKDGVSKLWSEVDVMASVKLEKSCK